MTVEEMLEVLESEQEDKKKDLVKELSGQEEPPCENVIQAMMRIIKKPTIPEASEGVYDAILEYLKGINRY